MFDNFVVPDLLPAAPELLVAGMALVILLVDAFRRSATQSISFVLAQLTLLGALALQVFASTGDVHSTFSQMFVDDPLSDVLKCFLYITVIVVLFYSRPYLLARPAMHKAEYYVLILFATLGMMVMISGSHFISLYIGLELLSLSLYALVASQRENAVAVEAAMKYFVLGALASGLLLYGMSMVYGATGSLSIDKVSELIDAGGRNETVLIFGLVFIVAGLAFKLGVVPFHMWIPDVYQGAPTSVTLFIGSAPKLAAFAMTMRLLVGGLAALVADWQAMLILLAVLSLAVGNLAAIAQHNIKRMLAYSTISHMGFVIIGLGVGVVEGDTRFALIAYSAAMFYAITYVITSAGAFGVIILLSHAGFEADRLDDFKGLNQRSPWLAFIMLMLMFSMAGIPFFVGFFAKFAVLQSVVIAGYYWLAIVAVLFSLIGAFYYLRVVKLMYFDAPENTQPVGLPMDLRLLISINGFAVALIGLFPHDLMWLCHQALVYTPF